MDVDWLKQICKINAQKKIDKMEYRRIKVQTAAGKELVKVNTETNFKNIVRGDWKGEFQWVCREKKRIFHFTLRKLIPRALAFNW